MASFLVLLKVTVLIIDFICDSNLSFFLALLKSIFCFYIVFRGDIEFLKVGDLEDTLELTLGETDDKDSYAFGLVEINFFNALLLSYYALFSFFNFEFLVTLSYSLLLLSTKLLFISSLIY